MNSSDELLAVRAAELYYDEGRTQDEIGAALHITRWKVGRLLAQAGVLASRAAAAADLAALAAADAARGLAPGEPCTVAAEVAARNDARISSCSIEGGDTVQVGTELHTRSPFGTATGLARAGPPAGEGTP